jgi:hypothetical protein
VELHDTLTTVIEVHDTLFSVPIPESHLSVTSTDSSHIENSVSASDAWWDGTTLHHSLYNLPGASLSVNLPVKTVTTTAVQQQPVYIPVKVQVEKELSSSQQFKLKWFPLSFTLNLLVLLALIIYLKKKFLSISNITKCITRKVISLWKKLRS